MITPMQKGIEAARVVTPPSGVYEGVDLRVLPKYVCFRAALLREKLTLQSILLACVVIFVGHYAVTRLEIARLYKKLREKEFILAPGVVDFTAVNPQSVSDSYVQSASLDFLSQLGNVNAQNIEEQYRYLAQSMSQELALKFQLQAKEWTEKVKTENLTEILTVTDREIVSDKQGSYKLTALARRDVYGNYEHLDSIDEVIQMTMKLIPPQNDKRWYLQITSLNRKRAEGFKAGSGVSKGVKNGK